MNLDLDFEGMDFADEMLRQIEKDYGRSIMRIPKFKRTEKFCFNITIIFTDYKIFEGEIKVIDVFEMPAIQIHGNYY